MRIFATGDWHIGEFPGPSKDGVNERALDTERRIQYLVEDARVESPDLVVISGDIFHASRTWSSRGIREVQVAASMIAALAEVAPVVIIRGTPNHDGAEHFAMLQSYFEGNDGVYIYTEPGQHEVRDKNDNPVSICALPGFDKGYWRAHHPGVDSEDESLALSEALENMILGMKAMSDQNLPSAPSILVGHFTIEGCNTESGQQMLFARYEPVVYQRTLAAANYDLCLFGHIHRPQSLDNHAFYCGAVNALNFNDEGQDRGYYIHELDGHELVGTRFKSLHPRPFKTIRMNDEQVAEFNLTGKTCWDEKDVEVAIVRVLYNCTDEHNKAFSRARLENVLYLEGAFWVQEITPENITITANRNALTGDNSPENNLRDYLLESGVDEGEIEGMMPLAREIIASVVEAGRSEKSRGLFVPIEISVTNYRNYRDETFNFDDVSFCTINGQNGAGKSSLFCDAIYDALYECPREGDLTGWICNDESVKSGAIKFTFRIGDQTWRVTRTRVKSGKATLNLSELVDGEWKDRSREKMRDTQTEIERVIGMDGLTLRACALIMQDQYGLFLQADKESRMKILSDILGLQIYDDMAEIATVRAADANRNVRQLQARKDAETLRLPAIGALNDEIAELDERLKENEQQQHDGNEAINKSRMDLAVAELAEQNLVTLSIDHSRLYSERRAKLTAIDEAKVGLENVTSLMERAIEIQAGVENYHSFEHQRDALRATIDERKTLVNGMNSAKMQISANEREIERVNQQMERAKRTLAALDERLARVPSMEQARAGIAEIDEWIAEYNKAAEKRDSINIQVTVKKSELAGARANANAEFKRRASEIQNLRQQANLLDDSGCPTPESATCKFLALANEAARRLPELTDEHTKATEEDRRRINVISDELDKLTAELESISIPTKEEYVAKQRQRDALTALSAELDNVPAIKQERADTVNDITGYEQDVKRLQDAISGEQKRIEEIQSKLDLTATAETDYQFAVAAIEKNKPYLQLEQQLSVASERAALMRERIENGNADLARINAQLTDIDTKAETERKKAAEKENIQRALSLQERTVRNLQETRDSLVGARSKALSAIESAKQIKASIDALSAEIEAAGVVAARCDTLKQAFGSNGIPHSIVRSVVPILEATASNILGQMSGGKMSVELVTEKVLKSNNKKEVVTLDIIINDADTGRLSYMSRSGGERVKAALAVILALSEVKSSDVGVQLGFLWLDEPPFLDGAGTQAYCDALETIQRRYAGKKIMAITHDESFKARFPQSVYVYKDEHGSHASMD